MNGDLVEFDEETGSIIGFKNKKIVDGENIVGFEVRFYSEEEFNEFVVVLAGMISSFGISFYMNKYLNKKLSEKVIESVVNNHIHASENEYYYLPLTRILLDEYFRNNNEIDLTCFIRYNVYGMKQELKSVAGYEVEMGGKLITANDKIGGDEVVIEKIGASGNGELSALVTILKTQYNEAGIKIDKTGNDVIHVFADGEQICVANNIYKKIDYGYFEKLDGINLNWLRQGHKNKMAEAMTSLVLCLEVFAPRQIVLYSSLSEKFVKDAKFNIDLYNKNHKDDTVDLFISKADMPGSLK